MFKKIIQLLIFFHFIHSIVIHKRFRRQILPSQHIQVHSIDSKVSFNDLITVDSTDGRIELSEKNVNGTIWAERSKLQFDTYDTFVNATAETAQSIVNILNCVFIHGISLESTLFMTTNRTSNGHTYFNHKMYDNANVSITDEGVKVQGIGARRVEIEAQTWEKYLEKTLTLKALNNPETGVRELMLDIVAPQYKINVCFFGAIVYIEFGDKLIQIDPDFSSVNIYTNKYLINFKTKDFKTPYDVKLTNEEVMIRCPQEQTTVFVQPSGVNVHVEKFSQMQIDRGGGEMTLGGDPLHADVVKVVSLAALLSLANDGLVRADTTKSEITVQTPVQNVGLTAIHHDIQVFGGVPHLVVEAGQAFVEVTASNGLPSGITLLPPFSSPEDRFRTIGPYQATNVTASPMAFPEPEKMNVTQSPLEGCGGGFGAIPYDQTSKPFTDQTPMDVTWSNIGSVTHQIVTYQTMPSNEDYSTQPTIESYTDEETTIQSITFEPETTKSEFPFETSSNWEVDEFTPYPTLINTPEWEGGSSDISTTTMEPITTTESGLTEQSTTTELNVFETTSNSEIDTTELVVVLPTDENPFSTDSSFVELSSTESTDIQTTEIDLPIPSELPFEITTKIFSTPSSVDIDTSSSTIDGIPFPSPLPTDDFLMAHWYSTEETSEESSTTEIPDFPEVPEIGITAAIGNVGIITIAPIDGENIPTPSPLGMNDNVSVEFPSFPTPNPLESNASTLPNFPILGQTNDLTKMFVLKMRIPDGVDVNSPEFAQNLTMSLKRLVRDTKHRLKKRVRRRIVENIFEANLTSYDDVFDKDEKKENLKDENDRNKENITTKSKNKENNRVEFPIKVNGIVKLENVTQVTFTLNELELTQEELEKALYDLETKDLNEYFDFPTTDHISSIGYRKIDLCDVRNYENMIIIIISIIIIIIIIIGAVIYFNKNSETSKILCRMGRHFMRYQVPVHSTTQDAFERPSV